MAVAPRLALDTNVLFDRAEEQPFAIEFCESFQQANFSLEVTQRVIGELYHFRNHGTDKEQQLAAIALDSLLIWRLSPVVLTDIQRTYKANFISIAQERRILPPREISDLHILAETAIAEIPSLVTSDGPLLEVNPKELQEAFNDAGRPFVSPVHPKRMMEGLRRRL